jgi:hypothetical protein
MAKPSWMRSLRWYEIAIIIATIGLLIAMAISPRINHEHIEAHERKRAAQAEREKQEAAAAGTPEADTSP